jgi:hypothetical protein
LLHDIICRTDDADAYYFDGISCYIPIRHLDVPSNISSDMLGIALYYVISIVAISSLSSTIPKDDAYVKVFPFEGWLLTREWMKDLRLASQATRKSSLTRVNILERVGPSCAWATSMANFLHLLAQMRRKVARVLTVATSVGVVSVKTVSFIVDQYSTP